MRRSAATLVALLLALVSTQTRADDVAFTGQFTQGGLVQGRVPPGTKVSLDQLLGRAEASTSGSANKTSGQAAQVGLNTATPPKAVLLVFYRGYW